MGDLKTHRDHPASMEERIRNRLRPSNDTANAESVTTVGHSPTRTITSMHHSRVHTHGEVNRGEGSITGHKRDVV